MNTKRGVTLGFAFVAVVAFFILRQLLSLVFVYIEFRPWEFDFLSVSDVGAVIGAIAVFVVMSRHQRATTFSSEVVLELSKVTWAARKETFYSTIIVVIMIGIASIILSIFDTFWGWLIKNWVGF